MAISDICDSESTFLDADRQRGVSHKSQHGNSELVRLDLLSSPFMFVIGPQAGQGRSRIVLT